MTISPIRAETENAREPSGAIIRAKAVGKKYPFVRGSQAAGQDFWALKDVSFEVASGQILGVIGRNGAGKTTLLNILAGILTATEGELLLRGKILGLFNLGVGFQDELSGRENLFLNGMILGADRAELESKFNAIVDFSELGEFINMPLGTYSQGMRLRLGFSIIANLDFDALVIDEVLAVGDALFQSKCYERLMDFKRAGKTLILTTQAMDLVERLCDQTILLDHGRRVFSGQTADAIQRYRTLLGAERFYVGSPKVAEKVIEDTKKWAEDLSEWGRKLGTRESMITSVDLINRWGFKCRSVKSHQPLKVRVTFRARNVIKEPHFGVAIFRNDGVYCYGPNTRFDGLTIREIRTGRGAFELRFKELLLAPGDYKISIAIWDKNEALPFDYHSGCYDLKVLGSNETGELLRIPCKINGRSNLPGERVPLSAIRQEARKNGVPNTASVQWLDAYGTLTSILKTRHAATLKVDFPDAVSCEGEDSLWVGIFREDDIYCQGFVEPLRGKRSFDLVFQELPLLPGGYQVRVGLWSSGERRFSAFQGESRFRMVFDKEDHGTLHLDHDWEWKLS